MDKSHFSKCEDTDKENVEGECVHQLRKIKIYTMFIHSCIVIALKHTNLGGKRGCKLYWEDACEEIK